MNQHDENELVQSGQPCSDCGSSDALAIYKNGTYCFSCEKYTRARKEMKVVSMDAKHFGKADTDKFSRGQLYTLKDRGISKDTCSRYGVTVAGKKIDGNVHITKHYYPYYSKTGEQVATKIRFTNDKNFTTEGRIQQAALFGAQLFPKGHGSKITITEGELDALAAYQMFGSKWPVVSIRNGVSGAEKDCKNNFTYLDSFKEIFICFDADEHGEKAARKVAKLFPGKARIVRLDPALKDACGYLKQGLGQEFQRAWWDSSTYVPEDIITGDKLFDLVQDKDPVECFSYPWVGLNELTYGFRLGETVVVSAQAKVGKTQFLREISHYVLHNHKNIKIGTVFLEGSPKEHALGFLSLEANKPLHLPDTEYTEEEFEEAKKKLPVDRLSMYSKYGTISPEGILGTIRYYIQGLGCNFIILDNLMALVSTSPTMEEREALNKMMTALVKLAEDNNVAIFVVAHLNREDKIHGTSLIEKQANMLIRLNRDKMAEDAKSRNTTRVEITDNRFSGETGVACELYYNKETGRMEEQEIAELDDTPIEGDVT